VAADLCELDGRTLLVIADYYSNFIEVARLNSVTSRSVIKEMIARYGIPDVLVTDNGAQFASAEFAVFAETWPLNTTRRLLVTHNPMEKQRTPSRQSSTSSQSAKHRGSLSTLPYLIGKIHQRKELEQAQQNAFSVVVARPCYRCLVPCFNRDTQPKEKREL